MPRGGDGLLARGCGLQHPARVPHVDLLPRPAKVRAHCRAHNRAHNRAHLMSRCATTSITRVSEVTMCRALRTHEWFISEKVGKRPRPRQPAWRLELSRAQNRAGASLPCCRSCWRRCRGRGGCPRRRTPRPRTAASGTAHTSPGSRSLACSWTADDG